MSESIKDAWGLLRRPLPPKVPAPSGKPVVWAALFWNDGTHVERDIEMTYPEVRAPSYARVPVDPLVQDENGEYLMMAYFGTHAETWPLVSAIGLYTEAQGGELFYTSPIEAINILPATTFDFTVRISDTPGSRVTWKTLLRAVRVL
jgi:hypothetical protein